MWYTLRRKVTGLAHIHHFILKSLAPLRDGDTVLDVGCGRGGLLADIRKKYGEALTYIGIDPDQDKLDIARKYLGEGVILKRAYASSLPVVPNSCDRIVCSLSFHHVPPEDREKSFLEIYKALKPGGKLLITEFIVPQHLGWALVPFNPCYKLAKGLPAWIEAMLPPGAELVTKKRQFDFIIHLVIIKKLLIA